MIQDRRDLCNDSVLRLPTIVVAVTPIDSRGAQTSGTVSLWAQPKSG